MEQYKILWSNQAKEDLFEIIEYIAFDDKSLALKILDKIEEKVAQLELLPMRGRIVSELKAYNFLTYREILLSPWRIIYKIEADKVYIISVLDGRRNIEDLLMKKLILK
ncbi:MAG: type II toxin-antitoxin system RelE/ParE family toxin [Eubacteriaceae bacterium]|nr:type II toxin-antitoxin system RelE/ParE family toxin [Eubacteriaceae bacterium]